MFKNFKPLILLVVMFFSAGTYGFITPDEASGLSTAVDGGWTELDAVEGGPGGIKTTFTNIDSLAANPSVTAWTTLLSMCDGNSQNDAEKYMSATGYLSGSSNDSVWVTVEQRTGSDNLVTVVDTLGYMRGGTAVTFRVSLSNYGRQYRFKFTPYTSGGGTANASTCDIEFAVYCAKLDQFNTKKKYTDSY